MLAGDSFQRHQVKFRHCGRPVACVVSCLRCLVNLRPCGLPVARVRLHCILFVFLCSYEKDRARQEQLARERIAAMKARRAAKKGKTEEEEQKELVEKLLKEQAEDSEADKRNALDMEQGGLALLQEAILSEMERKHASEQEVRFVQAYLTLAERLEGPNPFKSELVI